MHTLLRAGAVCWCLSSAMACSSSTISAPATITDYCAKRDSVVGVITGTTLDDDFEVMSRVLPGGFAGLTISQAFFTQPGLADSARSVAAIVAACPGDNLGNLWAIVRSAQVVKVKYDWVQLRHWYLLPKGGPFTGLVVSDIDEATNHLTYGFLTQANIDAYRAAAIAAGVPDDAMRFFIATPISPL